MYHETGSLSIPSTTSRKLADISLRCGDLPQYGGGLLIAEALALCYKDVAGLLDCSKRYGPALPKITFPDNLLD